MNTQHESQQHSNSRSRLVLLAFLAIAAFFLLTEHRAHLVGLLPWLPWLLLLACPLLHLFMHRGHDGHGEDEETFHKRGHS